MLTEQDLHAQLREYQEAEALGLTREALRERQAAEAAATLKAERDAVLALRGAKIVAVARDTETETWTFTMKDGRKLIAVGYDGWHAPTSSAYVEEES